MLESALAELLRLMPEATFHVVDRPRLKTEAWRWPRVVRHPPYQLYEPLQLKEAGWLRRAVLKGAGRLGRRVVGGGAAGRGFPLALPSWAVDPASLLVREPAGSLGDYCAPFDALLVAGGGNITDTFAWGLVQRVGLIRTFAEQRKPAVLTGQQIGPFTSRHSALLTARALRRASFVGVREPTASLDHVRSMGVHRHALMGDDSFGLAVDGERAVSLLRAAGLEPRKFLAVNVRAASYVPEVERHWNLIADLVRSLHERTGLPILVVAVAMGGKKSDIRSGHVLREAVGDCVVVLEGEDLSASAIKGVMGLAYGAVGVSYHFCTFALNQGVSAVCISDGAYYNQKGDGIASFWGDARLSLPLPGLDAETASRHVLSVLGDDHLRDGLVRRAEQATADWKQVYAQRVVPALRP